MVIQLETSRIVPCGEIVIRDLGNFENLKFLNLKLFLKMESRKVFVIFVSTILLGQDYASAGLLQSIRDAAFLKGMYNYR